MKFNLDRIKSHKIVKDLQLMEIHLGRAKEGLSGDVIQDKGWTVNFNQNVDLGEFDLESTLYENYRKVAEKHLDEIAIYINTTKEAYTNRELLQMIDEAAAGFKAKGIGENSKVGVMLNGSVEEAVTLFALNKIGALAKYIDFMKSVPAIIHNIEESPLDLLVFDECFLPLEEAINHNGTPVVVANTDKEMNDEQHISYEELYNYGDEVEVSPFDKKKNTITINSTGTSGVSKPINQSDYAVNAAALKMMFTDYGLSPDNVLVKMIPSQIGLGLITSLYSGLVTGTKVVMLSGSKTEELAEQLILFVKNFKDFRKENGLNDNAKLLVFTAPVFLRALIRSEEVKDLSFMGAMLGAGMKMPAKELDQLQEIAATKNCFIPIVNGYGQNELCGAVTLNQNNANKNGSAGFPTIGTNVIIVDPDTLEFLGLNQEGLILEQSDTEFLEYDNLEEETRDSKVVLHDGSVWFNTKDKGYMDNDGFVWVTGRYARVATKDGIKISIDVIEEKLRTIFPDAVCITTENEDLTNEIIAFVIGDGSDVENMQLIHNSGLFAPQELPTEVFPVAELPYKSAGKPNYKELEKMYKTIKNDLPRVLK